MESSPSNPINETSVVEKNDEDKGKNKKKKAEALGSFIVQPEASTKDDSKKESLFSFEPDADKKEKSAETPVEVISDDEVIEINQELAQDRAAQIEQELPATNAEDDAADAAAAEFITRTQETGDPDAAAEQVIDSLEQTTEEQPEDILENGATIPVSGSPPPTPSVAGSGGSGRPPRTPNLGSAAPAPIPLPHHNLPSPSSVTTSPNSLSPAQAEAAYRSGQNDGLLVGGIVGYLVGRRRGRIKTEKRLKPVQEKLEKQVVALKKHIADKETEVRVAAVRSYREKAPIVPKVPPERIGHVVVAAEAPSIPLKHPEKFRENPVATPEQTRIIQKQVERMDRQELLAVSKKIVVEGASLFQVYETHLISERALRRLVAEHLKGGDVARLLRREIVEREIDFERDPKLRDRARSMLSTGGRGAVTSLVQQAGVIAVEPSSTKVQGSKTKHSKKSAQKSEDKKRDSQMVADIALITVIGVLLAAITFAISR